MATKVITPEFRASFPNVFRPSKPMAGSTSGPKYGLTMLFKKGEDLSALKAAAEEAAMEKFGHLLSDKTPVNPKDPNSKTKGEVFRASLRSPFRDQGDKAFEGYEDGAIFINATSQQRPGLVDANMNDIIDESEFYAGCYGRASINAFGYDTAGNRGVAFGLNNVQKLRDGEPLGGRTRPEDDFEPVAEGAGAGGGVFD